LCCFITCIYVLSCDVRYDFHIKSMLGSSLPSVVCKKSSFLIYIMCVCLRIVVSNACFIFRRLVHPMLPVSVYCPFFIALPVFSNV